MVSSLVGKELGPPLHTVSPWPPGDPPQNEYYCRLDFLWKKKLRQEREETETMENLTRLLLENVLPAHVAPQFIGQNRRNEVTPHTQLLSPRCHRDSFWRNILAWSTLSGLPHREWPPTP